MNKEQEEFKKYVDEKIKSIYWKIDKEEKEFFDYLIMKFNEICERNFKAIELEEEIMYLANKSAITTQNVEVKAIRDRLEYIFEILKGDSNG